MLDLFTLQDEIDSKSQEKANDKILVELFEAYYDARKHKRNKKTALKFETNYESHIIKLHQEIINKTYIPQNSIAFINTKPVIREVFAARFQDRIIHHFIFNHINHIFEKTFIHDSYSCRKNKGTLFGIKQAETYIRQCSQNYTKDTYILKLDIKGYFYSMNKNILYSKIEKTLKPNKSSLDIDYDLLDFIIKQTIFTDHTKNAIKIKDDKNWKILPNDKSLYHAKLNCGLPIGNLTSQLFSNIYMNDFDHFVKNELNIKYYGRYVDDFFLIHNDKEYLLSTINIIKKKLETQFNLKVHPKKIYFQPYKRGMQFLGGYIKPNVRYISKRTKGNFNNLISKTNKDLNNPNNINTDFLFKLRAKFNSYLGLMSHFKSYKLRAKSLSKLNAIFYNYFYFSKDLSKINIKKGI